MVVVGLTGVYSCDGGSGSGRFIAGVLAGEASGGLAWRRSPGEGVVFLAAGVRLAEVAARERQVGSVTHQKKGDREGLLLCNPHITNYNE